MFILSIECDRRAMCARGSVPVCIRGNLHCVGYAVLSQPAHPCLCCGPSVCTYALQVAGRPACSYEYYRTFSTKVQINGWNFSTINIFLSVWGRNMRFFSPRLFYFFSVHFALNIFVPVSWQACLSQGVICIPCA
jgi:hypothetical protein